MDLFVVDAFTAERFSGNPAAVCLLDRAVSDAWMQSVASEMNLSETAFVCTLDGGLGLRWFTPTTEVDLCGHATLAAAHVLFQTGEFGESVSFSTASGDLGVRKVTQGLEMDFPAIPAEPIAEPTALHDALGERVVWCGRARDDLLVELVDEAAVRALVPRRELLGGLAARGVIVTALASEDTPADFVSRFFAPAVGIDEDPVTGSAHCALGPFWLARLNKTELVGYQASRRGGTVGVRQIGDRVLLGGSAVTVVRGSID